MNCSDDAGFETQSVNSGDEPAKIDPSLTIGHVAKTYQVTLRALRFYEESGLLEPKRHGNKRLYHSKDCRRLEAILKGRKLGFSVAEIGKLIRQSDAVIGSIDIEDTLTTEQIKSKIDYLEHQHLEIIQAINALRLAYDKISKPELQ